MKKNTQFEMYCDLRGYIQKYHPNDALDFVSNVYIFYYLSGRFPNSTMHDCCSVVETLRTHYMSEYDDLSCDDDELPFN